LFARKRVFYWPSITSKSYNLRRVRIGKRVLSRTRIIIIIVLTAKTFRIGNRSKSRLTIARVKINTRAVYTRDARARFIIITRGRFSNIYILTRLRRTFTPYRIHETRVRRSQFRKETIISSDSLRGRA